MKSSLLATVVVLTFARPPFPETTTMCGLGPQPLVFPGLNEGLLPTNGQLRLRDPRLGSRSFWLWSDTEIVALRKRDEGGIVLVPERTLAPQTVYHLDAEPTLHGDLRWLTASGPKTDLPSWPSEIHLGVEDQRTLVIFVGGRFFSPHGILADVAGREAFGTVNDGWAVVFLERDLVVGQRYEITLTLVDSAGNRSADRPAVSFIMPPPATEATVVLPVVTHAPVQPAAWHEHLAVRLFFFVVDPFVMAYLAARMLGERRRRRGS